MDQVNKSFQKKNMNIVPIKPKGTPSSAVKGKSFRALPLQEGREVEQLLGMIEDESVRLALRRLWVPYQSLQEASLRLASMYSYQWPDRFGQPAVISAIQRAYEGVVGCNVDGRAGHRVVIGTYLEALTSIADDVVRFAVWGTTQARAMKRWEPCSVALSKWIEQEAFQSVELREVPRSNDQAKWVKTQTLVAISGPEGAFALELPK